MEGAELKAVFQKPLVKSVDMAQEMSQEVVDLVVMAVDKFQAAANYEKAAQTIKEQMDKKYGSSWHVAVGEGFGFDVTYNSKNLVYVFYMGMGIVVFRY